MTEQAILRGINDVLRQHLGVTSDVGPDVSLVRDLRLDSLRQLTLIVELENRFRITFAQGDERGIETVRDLVRLIAQRLGEGG